MKSGLVAIAVLAGACATVQTTDIGRLEHALDHGYGGRPFVPKAAWDEVHARLQELDGRPLAPAALCTEIAEALALLPDAHIRAKLGGRCCGSMVARKPTVGRNYTERGPWAFDALTTGGATFGVLALAQLPSHTDAAWKGFDEAVQGLFDTHGILIDLRGNGGGDDTRGNQLARALLDAQPHAAAQRLHIRQSDEALTLLLEANGDEDPSFRTELEKLKASKRDEWAVRELPIGPQPLGSNAYRGPIAVLIDAGCASSCEATLQWLRSHPKTRVFGQRSGGFVQFGELGLLTLPHSHIEVWIPTKYWEFPEGVIIDKVGFAPDVEVPPGSDAFEPAMGWLRAQTPESRIRSAAEASVPQGQRAREAARLKNLGLVLPRDGTVVLEHPFATPLTHRSFVVPAGWLFRPPPKIVFAPALKADLEVLQLAFAHAYGGWASAEFRGQNWTEWFAKWNRMLASADETWLPLEQAFAPMKQLQALQLDNHTTVPFGLRFGSGSTVAVLSEAPSGACSEVEAGEKVWPLSANDAAQQPRHSRRFDGATLSDVWYLALPKRNGEPKVVRCGGQQIALKTSEPSGARSDDRPALRHVGESLAVLRLPTFSKTNGEIIARERPSWEPRTGQEKMLVVDLRANDGGDAAFEALEGWVDLPELHGFAAHEARIGASCLYAPLRWGYSALSSFGVKAPLTEGLRAELQTGLDALGGADSDAQCPLRFTAQKGKTRYRQRKGPPRSGKPLVVALVDGDCGSDCELMAEAISKLPEGLVVGVNTFGVAQFIQPGYSVLPNTRLPFRVSLGTADVYGDGRSFDGYGLDVDVLIDRPAAQTDEALLKLATLLSSPEHAASHPDGGFAR